MQALRVRAYSARLSNSGKEIMASYVQSALMPGEEIIYQGKCSLRAFWLSFLVGLFFALVLIGDDSMSKDARNGMTVFVLFLFARPFIHKWTTELAITNKRVIAKFGLISRRTVEINLVKIESIQVRQGILGRILNYGSIIVSGAGNPQAPIPNIKNPMKFRMEFNKVVDQISGPSK